MSVSVAVEFQRLTDRAVLVHYNDTPMWLPKSQIENWRDGLQWERGEEVIFILSDWIARQKNITSNTTADDSPINEDKFVASEAEGWAWVHSEGVIICRAANIRTARMIAAALALTEGKI